VVYGQGVIIILSLLAVLLSCCSSFADQSV
jgi:hypothetical protein